MSVNVSGSMAAAARMAAAREHVEAREMDRAGHRLVELAAPVQVGDDLIDVLHRALDVVARAAQALGLQ